MAALFSRRRWRVFGSTPGEGQSLRWRKSTDYPDYSAICGKFRDNGQPHLQKSSWPFKRGGSGEMAEWLKAHAWKACVRETVPWVRIPLSPPLQCSPLYPIVRIDSKNNDE